MKCDSGRGNIMKIIGIVGKKQVGKDSFANFVKELLLHQKVVKISLAHPLKNFVISLLNIDGKHMWGSDEDKNYPIAAWGKVFTQECLDKYKKDQYDLLSGREALQVIGTDVMRQGRDYLRLDYYTKMKEFLSKNKVETNNNIWINLCLKDIRKQDADMVIVPDIRFFNELDAFKKENAILVRIYKDTKKENSILHPSELEMEEMDDGLFNFIVSEENNKTLKDLKQKTMNFLYQYFTAF